MTSLRHLLCLSLLSTTLCLNAQTICTPGGNLILVTNYDGGPLDIVVDEDIPNLKIGLSSYEPMTVTISGTYAANVTAVWYAGYNSSAMNNHCAVIATTTVSAPASATVTIETLPAVTLPDPDGEPWMIYAYECNEAPYGGNTPAQVVDYFSTRLGGVLYWHRTQYDCYGSLALSGGGNCCLGYCGLVVNAGQDLTICEGDSAILSGVGGVSWTWTPADYLSDASVASPYAFPSVTTTYVFTGSDADGCSGSDTVVVFVEPVPGIPTIAYMPGDTLRCDPAADAYYWFLNGEPLPDTGRFLAASEAGLYSVQIGVGACVSTLSEEVIFFPTPASGLESSTQARIRLFPNPVQYLLHIRLSDGGTAPLNWEVHDMLGRRVFSGESAGDYTMDVSGWPAGAYRVSLSNGGQTLSSPFVVIP